MGGRLAIIALGFALMSGFDSDSPGGWIAGVAGLVLALAAVGIVEVGMALWYRARRRYVPPN